MLTITEQGAALLKGLVSGSEVQLFRQPRPQPKGSRREWGSGVTRDERESWQDVDRELFEALREVRLRLARERGIPPYVVFHDRTLREMARLRPTTMSVLGTIYGVGARKAETFGPVFLAAIEAHVGRGGASFPQGSLS